MSPANKRIHSTVLVCVIALYCSGCSEKTKGTVEGTLTTLDTCHEYRFEIDSLPYAELPNTGFAPMAVIDSSRPHDSRGVLLYRRDDGRLYYHPVAMCIFAVRLVDLYRRTGEEPYLDMLQRYLDRLRTMAVIHDSAVYFPYTFDHFVHGSRRMPLEAPWYSGMAQGTILGLFTRAFVATGDSSHLSFADSIFNSLQRLCGEAEPWVVFIDAHGCFWIEEYPVEPPTMTLNGFVYALYGVYDYYQVTKDERAGQLLQSGFSTLRNYVPVFRVKGGSSLYELRTEYWDRKYHFVHIKQLRQLYRITRDRFFADWADSLEADTREPD